MNLYMGAAYYPEVWEEDEIKKDVRKMKELGVNCIRLAEFAWSTMEPTEGVFDFSLFSRVIDWLGEEGIYVVLGTPSATPPKWLTDRYPETMITGEMGVKWQFGGRGHACKSSPIMREKNRVIIEKMCKALGDKPNVVGWQIDNEIFPYNGGCFCPLCVNKFRKYLRGKYGSIENLNKAWRTARWSLTYPSFDDVLPPRSDTWNHPSLSFEWITFQGKNIIEYVAEQAEELRKYTSLPVGTDMMTRGELSHSEMNACLDVAQINHYDKADTYFRSLFWLDYMRSIKSNPFWIVETQPCWFGAHTADGGGRVAGSAFNNVFATFIKGGNMHLFWHFRSHPCGQELMHGALVDSVGREYYSTPEIVRAFDKVRELKEVFTNYKAKASVALVCSTTAENQLNAVPMCEGFAYEQEVQNVYRSLLGYGVDVVDESRDLAGYEVLITPYLSHISNEYYEKIRDWVEKGGRWIVGAMTDVFDDTLSRSTKSPFWHIEDLAGVELKYAVAVDHGEYGGVWSNGTPLPMKRYYDGYVCKQAKSLAHYETGELAGLSVITENKVGKGSVVLVGSLVQGEAYATLTGKAPLLASSGNLALNRLVGEGEILSCLEVDGNAGYLELDGKYLNLMDGKAYTGRLEIPPYGVLLLERTK